MLEGMTGPNPLPDLPDEVSVADAIEQTRSAVDSEEPVDDYASAPLESNESDWQEQHQVVDDFGEDEFR